MTATATPRPLPEHASCHLCGAPLPDLPPHLVTFCGSTTEHPVSLTGSCNADFLR